MRDKVQVRVRVPPDTQTFVFLVPASLAVTQVTELMARVLRTSGSCSLGIREQPLIMPVQGMAAGRVLDGDVLVEELIRDGVLAEGSTLVLV